jgi:effector-binding domain-containing protein
MMAKMAATLGPSRLRGYQTPALRLADDRYAAIFYRSTFKKRRIQMIADGKEMLMIGTPEITETRPRAAAVIHVTVPRDEIRTVMPGAIREILATLSGQGIAPAGPLFDHHLKTSEQAFDFEVGFPIVAPMQPTGRVKNGELPGGRIARAVMSGDYEGLANAWAEFREWMKREGHASRGDFWQIFTAGPESSPDPANWRTELCLPLKPND